MNPDLFNELRKIRSQVAHRSEVFDQSALATRFADLGFSLAPDDRDKVITLLLRAFDNYGGFDRVPPTVLQVLGKILETHPAKVVCDPWAGLGEVLAGVLGLVKPDKAFAFTQNDAEFTLGRLLVPRAEWKLGNPVDLLPSLNTKIDVALSILPFNARSNSSVVLKGKDGSPVELRDDLGGLIIAATAGQLTNNGVGIFVTTPSFFFSQRSVFKSLPALGVGIEAALALPSGSFAPYTNIPTYIVLIRKRAFPKMFVAQLSVDENTNAQIFKNLNEQKEGVTLDLGRLVDPASFTGLESIRTNERLSQERARFGAPMVGLRDLSTTINLGRFGDDFRFPALENTVFVPLVGNSDVVESVEEMNIKPQNYAQIAIDPARSNARFVAHFLNSELGKELRELNKSGAVIPKLNKQTLRDLAVFVPDVKTQREMLEIEAGIASEQNIVLGLQNELAEIRRELWANPNSATAVTERLASLSPRISGSLKQHASESLDHWFETLPFPLASILRAWQATPTQDFKTKYEHLLHFFEALAEFVSVILLSAFSSNPSLFASHKVKITESMRKQNLSFEKATFGAWKLVVEYLGKQTRELLNGDKDARALCAELFSDPTLLLPESLSNKGLAATLSATNKMRNDWTGHGGVVGQTESQLRNEQLLAEVQKLREPMGDTWNNVQLVHALHCRPRHGEFENEIEILMGSNSEFLKETRSIPTWLDVERLYLCSESGQALKLLPLVQVGPSPQSAKNACYFFNRLERDGDSRFVSYHFIDKPELTGRFSDAHDAIKLLTEP